VIPATAEKFTPSVLSSKRRGPLEMQPRSELMPQKGEPGTCSSTTASGYNACSKRRIARSQPLMDRRPPMADRCPCGHDPAWLPCPKHHAGALAIMLGSPATPEQKAASAAKAAAMRSNGGGFTVDGKSQRALDLEGQTIGGCLVLRRAADATHASRFLCKMACGHEQIIAGTDLKQEAKVKELVTCKACAKVARRTRSRV